MGTWPRRSERRQSSESMRVGLGAIMTGMYITSASMYVSMALF